MSNMNKESYIILNSHNEAPANEQLENFWPKTMLEIENLKYNDFRMQELPLARIKKIMKMDEDVKMISAEAPVLFAKAAELFITELTLRGWVHAEDNKRRTLQRNDIANAISRYDQFDFLIDIVPREEIRPTKRIDDNISKTIGEDQIQYYIQVGSNGQVTTTTNPPQNLMQTAGTPIIQQGIQLLTSPTAHILTQLQHSVQQQQIITQPPPAQPQPAHQMQVFTQVIGPNGEVQQIPIQLTQAQLQAITAQMQGKQPGQPIVIQTNPLDQTSGNNNQSE